ncbi:hypothetical protein [Streptomyces huiliensis]|uniref:hypothetical protein n=1 Tax=Streptomyces huiliensis TaxID=2876027 RepID=UPI001CC07405|nr:hypothetical protein [Streptomyces huiliensis]MBZ4318244.1 hypothetical protein [Streptomyces huiliensis]
MVFNNGEGAALPGRSLLRDLAVVRCLCRRALLRAVSYDGRSGYDGRSSSSSA